MKSLVPSRLKQRLRGMRHGIRFRTAMKRFRRAPDEAIEDSALLRELVVSWGNSAWSADTDLLQEALRAAARAQGKVLECGSGLSTLLLGVVLQQRGLELWSLEHDATWFERMRDAIARQRLSGVRLRHAPLSDYGAFHWYGFAPEEVSGTFSLVICDGPPGNTPGGRGGLLPVLRSCLAPDVRILVDDADRDSERDMAHRWAEALKAEVDFRGARASIAVISAGPVHAPEYGAADTGSVR